MQIYQNSDDPGAETRERLISKYYQPYHRKVDGLVSENSDEILLSLDCHSMEPIPPKIAPDRDSARPLICLGDANGESCRENWTQVLRHSLIESFGLEAADVTINQPFAGGYITRTYGNRPVPWIQVELNRKLYLSDADFDSDSLRMKTNRLSTLSEQFRRAIGQFVTRIHARR